MGGPGSGRWFRWDKKAVLEDLRSIDVRDWARRGLLRPGSWFTWRWYWRDKEMGNIGVRALHDEVVLSYTAGSGEERQEIEERIWLSSSETPFNGCRPWFLCPRCSRRIAKLYLLGRRFMCRQCTGLAYASQQETLLDRATRRAFKLRKRLGDDGGIGDPVWRKPKGMHRATFERLRARIERQDEIAERTFSLRAMSLPARERR